MKPRWYRVELVSYPDGNAIYTAKFISAYTAEDAITQARVRNHGQAIHDVSPVNWEEVYESQLTCQMP